MNREYYDIIDGSKVFFTSDTHFGHRNIIKFCERPWGTIEEHDQALIDNWNSVVSEDCTVFHLGDFAFGNFEFWNNIRWQLNGTIVLIRGNHDFQNNSQELLKLGQMFDAVEGQMVISVEGQKILLNHYPLLTWQHIYDKKKPTWQLFGHVHLRKGITGADASTVARCCIPTQYEVGVDLNGYMPVSFSQLRERIDFQVKHNKNVIHWIR